MGVFKQEDFFKKDTCGHDNSNDNSNSCTFFTPVNAH